MHSPKSITPGRSVRHFYQGERLATQMSNQGDSTSVLWAQEAALAQQSAEGAQLLQADQPGSVLGMQGLGLMHGMAYAPYGHRVDDERAAVLGFNGQWREPVTWGYLLGNGHRLYRPGLMRFNSPDGLSPFGKGGVNAYGYCAGDPVNRLDPTGQTWSGFLKLFSKGRRTGLTQKMVALKVADVDFSDLKKVVKTELKATPVSDPDELMMRRFEGVSGDRYSITRSSSGVTVNMTKRAVTPARLSSGFLNSESQRPGGFTIPYIGSASTETALLRKKN